MLTCDMCTYWKELGRFQSFPVIRSCYTEHVSFSRATMVSLRRPQNPANVGAKALVWTEWERGCRVQRTASVTRRLRLPCSSTIAIKNIGDDEYQGQYSCQYQIKPNTSSIKWHYTCINPTLATTNIFNPDYLFTVRISLLYTYYSFMHNKAHNKSLSNDWWPA